MTAEVFLLLPPLQQAGCSDLLGRVAAPATVRSRHIFCLLSLYILDCIEKMLLARLLLSGGDKTPTGHK